MRRWSSKKTSSIPVSEPAPPLDNVPPGVRLAAAWSWRVLVILAAITVMGLLIVKLREIAIPVFVAMVISALLVPFKDRMVRARFPRWAAITVAELSVIVGVSLLLYLVVTQVGAGFGRLRERALTALDDFAAWLAASPLHITGDELSELADQGWAALQANVGSILPGVLSAGSTVGHVLVGILLALFTTLFILIDGDRIWSWMVRLFPKNSRAAVDGAGRAGWGTLQSFVKVQILVAIIDAVGIAGGAAILGVPLAIPIGVLVFLGSFIPVVGAVVTGAFAVAIALIYNGWLIAVVMLAIVLLVQQIEGHVLQPLIMGNAVKVHPLAVVLAVAAGSMLAGIPGAFFAVPLVAVLNSSVSYIASGRWRVTPAAPAVAAALRSPAEMPGPRRSWFPGTRL